jgi:hypothetical protein
MEFITRSLAKKATKLSYLGRIDLSSKIEKNSKVFKIKTYSIYLSPAKTSGYEVCPFSTVECRMGCLATSGRAISDIISGRNVIKNSRIKKTRLFFEENDFFMEWLIAEITAANKLAKKQGYDFAVRLNATSDIDWQNTFYKGKNIFQIFPEIHFYDYTKNINKFKNIPLNYHLTYSYTGRNWHNCLKVLNQGGNVAIVFAAEYSQPLPTTYNGFKVINGDVSDYRPFDPKGCIVGLHWKKIANKTYNKHVKESLFVVKV